MRQGWSPLSLQSPSQIYTSKDVIREYTDKARGPSRGNTHEDTAHHGYLQRGRNDTEQDSLKHERDAPVDLSIRIKRGTELRASILCSAIDGAGETASFSGEMEFEVEIEQVLKGLTRDLAYGALADVGKDCIQQFAEHGGARHRLRGRGEMQHSLQ